MVENKKSQSKSLETHNILIEDKNQGDKKQEGKSRADKSRAGINKSHETCQKQTWFQPNNTTHTNLQGNTYPNSQCTNTIQE